MSKIKLQTPMGEMKEASVIGPSNLGTLFGVNKYENTYDMWLRLTARKIRETNQFAQRGIDLEKYIAMEYSDRMLEPGCDLRVGIPFKKHSKINCFGCYTDGDVYEYDGKEHKVYKHSINIKTISSDFGAENFDDPTEWVMKSKPDWFYQAQGEMSIDGSDSHDIIVWAAPVAEYDTFLRTLIEKGAFDEKKFRDNFFDAFPILAVITILRDDKVIMDIEERVQKFWKDHIEADVPPAVSEQELAPARTVSDKVITVSDPELAKAIIWVKQTRERLGNVEDEVWAKLNDIDAHEIRAGDVKVYKNPNTPRRSLSTNLMLAELPKLAINKAFAIGENTGCVVGDKLYKDVADQLQKVLDTHFEKLVAKLPIPDMGIVGSEMKKEIMEDFATALRIHLTQPKTEYITEASKGLDYSICYQTSKPSAPFNYRFGK